MSAYAVRMEKPALGDMFVRTDRTTGDTEYAQVIYLREGKSGTWWIAKLLTRGSSADTIHPDPIAYNVHTWRPISWVREEPSGMYHPKGLVLMEGSSQFVTHKEAKQSKAKKQAADPTESATQLLPTPVLPASMNMPPVVG